MSPQKFSEQIRMEIMMVFVYVQFVEQYSLYFQAVLWWLCTFILVLKSVILCCQGIDKHVIVYANKKRGSSLKTHINVVLFYSTGLPLLKTDSPRLDSNYASTVQGAPWDDGVIRGANDIIVTTLCVPIKLSCQSFDSIYELNKCVTKNYCCKIKLQMLPNGKFMHYKVQRNITNSSYICSFTAIQPSAIHPWMSTSYEVIFTDVEIVTVVSQASELTTIRLRYIASIYSHDTETSVWSNHHRKFDM